MEQAYDTKRGNTAGVYGLNDDGLVGGMLTADVQTLLDLQGQLFPEIDQVPYSPGGKKTDERDLPAKH